MKTMNLSQFWILAFLAVGFAACGPTQLQFGTPQLNLDDDGGGSNQAINNPEEAIVGPAPGVRNALQLNQTYYALTGNAIGAPLAAATGVSGNIAATNLEQVFATNKPGLPVLSKLSSLQPTHRVAMARVAAAQCRALSQNATLRTGLLSDAAQFGLQGRVVFGAPGVTPTAAQVTNAEFLVDALLDKFWTGKLSRSPASANARKILLDLIPGLLSEADQSSADIVMGLCTAALVSSPTALIY